MVKVCDQGFSMIPSAHLLQEDSVSDTFLSLTPTDARCVGRYLENMTRPWGTLFLPRLSQLPRISSFSFPDSSSILPRADGTTRVFVDQKRAAPLQDKTPQGEDSHNTWVNLEDKVERQVMCNTEVIF